MINKTEETIFSKIIRKEIPVNIIYQDKLVTAFYDKYPKTPVHVLIVTNKIIPTINDITTDDEIIIGRLFTVAKNIAQSHGISESGYRLIINCNSHGGQEIFHLHVHLLGGRSLGPLVVS
ncbi:HIT domain-containing protein [Candidatus Schneideria nysicola]|uniref:HIT domain-containing protein n=1 Tax=Candidatus Schneideria nysicola TaxID=1081631 RepID=UPI001CAA4C6E|nr:HIT domain-containing protein [Candidatus Schneideria nysicola]UAJ65395.1 HIT domain-containing protein [Candidatus Schneideria nysicola]